MFKAKWRQSANTSLIPISSLRLDQFVVKLRATASGLERQRQGWHGSQQSFLADLAARPGYSKKEFIGRNHCYKAVQLSHGAFDPVAPGS